MDAARECLVQARRIRLAHRRDNAAVFRPCDGRLRQAVLFIGVQLTIVRHLAERLRHRGLAVRVGRKPRVEKQGAGFVVAVLKIKKVRHNFPRIQLPLQNLRFGRQGDRIEPGNTFCWEVLLVPVVNSKTSTFSF